ncbi:SAM hydrolase/SAM-dependent halogenase family protein [Desulfothermobacter acidiphilus]|uniref:SAM hydrolase/SAM-dependent halogenase family protein n=1 Tax=Desulfothermobacter acidiphilus TaxID=1938353 RepID=UPI003F8CEB97
MRLIVFLSDFGFSAYVGVVKGVILTLCPGAAVVDLTHAVTPFAVREGAWHLLTGYAYFPEGSIFLAVVDPGVGGERQPLAVRTRRYYLVGPDNGLLYPVLEQDGLVEAVALPRPPGVVSTFEARDVFAPAVAALARGEALISLGTPTTVRVPLRFHRRGREGEVVVIDAFGNLITNLPPCPEARRYHLGSASINLTLPFYPTYAHAPAGELFVTTGSSGTLEIALSQGRAANALPLAPGTKIKLTAIDRLL